MKNIYPFSVYKTVVSFIFIFIPLALAAQEQSSGYKSKSDFWQKIQFGGGIGLSIGSGYTDITLAPSAIYNFNRFVALGLGAQYTYVKQKDFYASNLYGGNLIGLFNPIEKIQLSVELEQLRVNVNLIGSSSSSQDFWNTGLFLGAGYRTGNATIGARYNLLFRKNDFVYSDAFMPFIRVYF